MLLLVIGIVAPILIYLWYLVKLGVNVPILDQWDLIPILKAYHNHDNWLSLIFKQHNEHRPMFPYLIFLALAQLTHWNVKVEMFVSMLICILNFILIWRILAQTDIKSKWILILFSWLVFSLGQWQNILWGWQLQWYLAIFGILVSIYFLTKVVSSGWYLVPAILGGILASFSLNNGLLIWPLGLVQLWFTKRELAKKINFSMFWLFAGIIVFVTYYVDYTKPAHHPPILLFLEKPGIFLQCWLANFGLGLGGENIPLSIGMGAFILISFVAFFFLLKSINKERLFQLMPWLILGFFAFISLTLISMARLGLGIQLAVASRYVTIASLLVISIIVLSITSLEEVKDNLGKRKLMLSLNIIFLAVLSIGILITLIMGWEKGERVYLERMKAVVYIHQCEFVPDDGIISVIFPRPWVVRERTPFLKDNKLSLFYNYEEFNLSDYHEMTPLSNEQTGSIDNLEVIPPSYSNVKDEVLYIRGWAIDPVTNKIPKAVFIFWDKQLLGRAFPGGFRPDVAQAMGNNNIRTCGWEIFTSKINITPGLHKIMARVLFDNNGKYYKDIIRELNVK